MFDISANRRELLIAPLLATMPTAFLSEHAAILRRKRLMPDLRRACVKVWELLTKQTPPRIYSRGSHWPHHAIERASDRG